MVVKYKRMTPEEYYERCEELKKECFQVVYGGSKEKRDKDGSWMLREESYSLEHITKELGSELYRKYLDSWSMNNHCGSKSLEKKLVEIKKKCKEKTYEACKSMAEQVKIGEDSANENRKGWERLWIGEFNSLKDGIGIKFFKNYLKKRKIKIGPDKMFNAVTAEEFRIINCLQHIKKELKSYLKRIESKCLIIEEEPERIKNLIKEIEDFYENMNCTECIMEELVSFAKHIVDMLPPFSMDFLNNPLSAYTALLGEILLTHDKRMQEYKKLLHYKKDTYTECTLLEIANKNLRETMADEKERVLYEQVSFKFENVIDHFIMKYSAEYLA